MSSELTIFESQLTPLAPKFSQVLGKMMPVDRFMRTLLVSCEREPKLLQVGRQSLLNAAMTGAVLGLEADGATGQFFLLPFGNVAQPCIGYKGYNTLAARSGITVAGGVVREGDEFEYEDGTHAFVRHKKRLGGDALHRPIIAAWSTAMSNSRPATIKVLSIGEVLAIKAKSPRGHSPPWSDDAIGFPAMAEKSAKRRLARDMPLNVFQQAARMEEAFEEQALPSYIHPDKGVIAGGEVVASNYNDVTPSADDIISPPTLEQEAKMAAERGTGAFKAFCNRMSKTKFAANKDWLEKLIPIAEAADREGS